MKVRKKKKYCHLQTVKKKYEKTNESSPLPSTFLIIRFVIIYNPGHFWSLEDFFFVFKCENVSKANNCILTADEKFNWLRKKQTKRKEENLISSGAP